MFFTRIRFRTIAVILVRMTLSATFESSWLFNAVLERSARVEPKRTSEAIAIGALRSSNASVEARARRMALSTGLFTAVLHSYAKDGDVAQSRRGIEPA